MRCVAVVYNIVKDNSIHDSTEEGETEEFWEAESTREIDEQLVDNKMEDLMQHPERLQI